jgi:eukaryotic-like serine/threonine-protein kinase
MYLGMMLSGRKYRLPSEAEWEYACRAKTDTPFYFGETIHPELANDRNGFGKDVYRSQATPIGSFPANGFGLYDMHGNVWEWCQDEWHKNYQGAPIDGSAWTSNNNSQNFRLVRGNYWNKFPGSCRSAFRIGMSEDHRSVSIGFRVVCTQDSFTPYSLGIFGLDEVNLGI